MAGVITILCNPGPRRRTWGVCVGGAGGWQRGELKREGSGCLNSNGGGLASATLKLRRADSSAGATCNRRRRRRRRRRRGGIVRAQAAAPAARSRRLRMATAAASAAAVASTAASGGCSSGGGAAAPVAAAAVASTGPQPLLAAELWDGRQRRPGCRSARGDLLAAWGQLNWTSAEHRRGAKLSARGSFGSVRRRCSVCPAPLQ